MAQEVGLTIHDVAVRLGLPEGRPKVPAMVPAVEGDRLRGRTGIRDDR
jgi:hypothetical protein